MFRFFRDAFMNMFDFKNHYKQEQEIKEYIRIEHIDFNMDTGKWENKNRLSYRMRKR